MAVPESLLAALRRCAAQDYTKPLDLSQYQGTEYEALAVLVLQIAKNAAASQLETQTFVSNVAHELRTPVTILRGMADGLLDGTVPKAQRTEVLSILSQETQRLEAIIQSMLQLTRMERGETAVEKTWFTLGDLVFQTLLLFQNRIEKRRIQIEGLEALSVRIYADRALMGQVIFNLVDNAVKFVNTGGIISFAFDSDGDAWQFTIRNTGVGFTPEEARRLFQRFYQTARTSPGNATGLGIGLDLAWRILALHQGTITAEGQADAYGAFTLHLPKPTDTESA